MRAAISCLVVSLLLHGEAPAVSIMIEVAPKAKKASGFAFAVTGKKTKKGVIRFRIEMTEKGAAFSSKPSANLGVVKRSETTESITGTKHKVKTKRSRGKMVCTFSVKETELKDPDLCFVFANYVEEVIDGKIVPRPAATFYYLRLQHFWRSMKE